MSLLTNLVAYYKLDTNSNDSVGSVNGTDTSVTYGTGIQSGGAVASTSLISLGAGVALGTTWSIQAWFKPNTAGGSGDYGYILGKLGGSTAAILTRNTGKLQVFNSATTTASYAMSAWNHVVVTYTGSSVKVYLNGTLDSTHSFTIPTVTVDAFLKADVYGFSDRFDGTVDEIGLWTRVLTAGEVTDLYNFGSGIPYPLTPVIPVPNWVAKRVAGASSTLVNDWTFSISNTRPIHISIRYKRFSFVGSFRVGFQCLNIAKSQIGTVWAPTIDCPASTTDTNFTLATTINLDALPLTSYGRYVIECGVSGSTAHSAGEVWFDSANIEHAFISNLDDIRDGGSYGRVKNTYLTGGGDITSIRKLGGAVLTALNIFDKASDTLDLVVDGTTYGRTKNTQLQSGFIKDGTIYAGALAAGMTQRINNGKFQQSGPNAVSSLPDHWTSTTSVWPTDIKIGTSTTNGRHVLFDTGAKAADKFKSSAWAFPRNCNNMRVTLIHRPHGTMSYGSRYLDVTLKFYAEETLTTLVGTVAASFGTTAATAPAETWVEESQDFNLSSSGVSGANFVTVEINKSITSTAFSWDVAEVNVVPSEVVAQEPWIAPSLLNSFANYDTATFNGAGYFKDTHGIVHIRGVLKRTSSSTSPVFQLPAAYRCGLHHTFSIVADSKFARVLIDPSGQVSVPNADSATWYTYFSLDGIHFDTRL
jgi:Concanavalin A-like lectin/glucanases superfamily